MLKVLVVDEPGHFRQGVIHNLTETGLDVTGVAALHELPRAAGEDTIVALWHTDFSHAREFVILKRLVAANPMLSVIVLVDKPNRILLDAAHNNGARGLILSTTPAPLMRGAIELIALGGTAFPVYPPITTDMLSSGFPVAAVKGLLTEQHLRLVAYLASDLTNPQIATALGIAVPTVKQHLKEIHRRLGASSRAGVVAICAGLMPPGVPAPRERQKAA